MCVLDQDRAADDNQQNKEYEDRTCGCEGASACCVCHVLPPPLYYLGHHMGRGWLPYSLLPEFSEDMQAPRGSHGTRLAVGIHKQRNWDNRRYAYFAGWRLP